MIGWSRMSANENYLFWDQVTFTETSTWSGTFLKKLYCVNSIWEVDWMAGVNCEKLRPNWLFSDQVTRQNYVRCRKQARWQFFTGQPIFPPNKTRIKWSSRYLNCWVYYYMWRVCLLWVRGKKASMTMYSWGHHSQVSQKHHMMMLCNQPQPAACCQVFRRIQFLQVRCFQLQPL